MRQNYLDQVRYCQVKRLQKLSVMVNDTLHNPSSRRLSQAASLPGTPTCGRVRATVQHLIARYRLQKLSVSYSASPLLSGPAIEMFAHRLRIHCGPTMCFVRNRPGNPRRGGGGSDRRRHIATSGTGACYANHLWKGVGSRGELPTPPARSLANSGQPSVAEAASVGCVLVLRPARCR